MGGLIIPELSLRMLLILNAKHVSEFPISQGKKEKRWIHEFLFLKVMPFCKERNFLDAERNLLYACGIRTSYKYGCFFTLILDKNGEHDLQSR